MQVLGAQYIDYGTNGLTEQAVATAQRTLNSGNRAPESFAELVAVSQYDYSPNVHTLTMSIFLLVVFLCTGTVNKSNVVTASTSIQLLDERKSPVVAGKQWISVTMASIHLVGQLLLCGMYFFSKKQVSKGREGKRKLLIPQLGVISSKLRLIAGGV